MIDRKSDTLDDEDNNDEVEIVSLELEWWIDYWYEEYRGPIKWYPGSIWSFKTSGAMESFIQPCTQDWHWHRFWGWCCKICKPWAREWVVLLIQNWKVPSNAISAPYKISRPQGGEGPRLKFANITQGNIPNHSNIVAEPQSLPHNLSAATSALQTEEMVALVARTLFDLLDKHNITPIWTTESVVLTKLKAPAVRTHRPQRTILAVSFQRCAKEHCWSLYREKSIWRWTASLASCTM